MLVKRSWVKSSSREQSCSTSKESFHFTFSPFILVSILGKYSRNVYFIFMKHAIQAFHHCRDIVIHHLHTGRQCIITSDTLAIYHHRFTGNHWNASLFILIYKGQMTHIYVNFIFAVWHWVLLLMMLCEKTTLFLRYSVQTTRIYLTSENKILQL